MDFGLLTLGALLAVVLKKGAPPSGAIKAAGAPSHAWAGPKPAPQRWVK